MTNRAPVSESSGLVGIGRVEDKRTVNGCYPVVPFTNDEGVCLQHGSQRLRPREVEVEGQLAGLLDIGGLQTVVVGVLVALRHVRSVGAIGVAEGMVVRQLVACWCARGGVDRYVLWVGGGDTREWIWQEQRTNWDLVLVC